MLELSLGETLSATLRDYLTTAHDAAQSLLATLDGGLETAGSESGDGQRHPDPHERPAAVQKAVRPLDVLVADDTPSNQKVVMAVLAKRGHSVELADDGRQALDRVRQRRFDVVLMDAQMPAMNGLDAATAIRRLSEESRARIPIIGMTTRTQQYDRERCLAAGMDDYMPKPIDVGALIARVEFHGAMGRSARTSEARSSAPFEGDGAQNRLSAALDRLGGDEHLLAEMARLFPGDAAMQLESLRAALRIHDAQTASRAAHNLRGLAANFDAMPTIEAARSIERLVQAGDFSTASEALIDLEANLAHLQRILEDYCASRP